MGKLAGKVALVTGASSGIGEATALALAGEGAVVVAAARREDRLAGLVDRISTAGGTAHALKLDVTDEAAVEQAMGSINASLGRLDILVNNAGVMLLGPIQGADTDDWRRMVDTNIMGLLYCTHAALPIMKSQQSGHIVNISSVAGRTARAGVGVYNATKWAVCGFSEALRQEALKDRIRVTVVEPGAVLTELQGHITVPEVREEMLRWVNSMRSLTSEDIASAIVYAVTQPDHVNVNEILIRPVDQER